MTRENDDACSLSTRHPEVPERSEGLEGRRPRSFRNPGRASFEARTAGCACYGSHLRMTARD